MYLGNLIGTDIPKVHIEEGEQPTVAEFINFATENGAVQTATDAGEYILFVNNNGPLLIGDSSCTLDELQAAAAQGVTDLEEAITRV